MTRWTVCSGVTHGINTELEAAQHKTPYKLIELKMPEKREQSENAITPHWAHTFGPPLFLPGVPSTRCPPALPRSAVLREGSSQPRSQGKDAAPGVAPFSLRKIPSCGVLCPQPEAIFQGCGALGCRALALQGCSSAPRDPQPRPGGLSAPLRARFWGGLLNPR